MVICKYFLNGNCRFGTKCVNEHLDVKQILKSDVESAVNGNQWPLSCFGPFKEKPCIPNFIEDQSFEEIRMLCYGSKKQNFFENFNQQFTKEVIEAKNKMKMLLTLNKDVMDVVLNLYNSIEPAKGNTQSNTNPFGLSAANNAQQNGNLFGTSTLAQGGSPFGGSNNVTSVGGIFNSGQKSVLGQSAFSSFSTQQQPQQQQQQNAGIFGSAQPQQQQQQPQTNAFSGNIFAQATQQKPVGGNSIFGGMQPQQTQPFGGTTPSVFGQAPNSGNIFAQEAQQSQQQQQPAVGGNIFGQAAQQTQQGFGMFSQPTQQNPPPFGGQMTQQSPFGGAQQQQQKPFFGQSQQQQQNSGNIFTSQAQMLQQQQQQHQQQQQQQQQLQHQQQQQQQLQQQQQQQIQHQQQQAAGMFATSANSPFGVPQQEQQQQPNIFAQAAATYPQQQQQQTMVSDRTYSKMENLTAAEIEAFKAETFELGKIPFSPPPRELVN